MSAKNKSSVIAQKLLHISRGADGLLSEDRIRAVMEVLPREHGTLAILKEYFILVERELRKRRMLISSPTELSTDTVKNLRTHFEQMLGQKFSPQTAIDDSLIAGVRVRVGDRIFEKSLAGTLEALRTIA